MWSLKFRHVPSHKRSPPTRYFVSIFICCIHGDMSSIPLSSQSGCCMGLKFINHLFYADDLCILAPSPSGLQTLMNHCHEYGSAHDIIFNPSNSICLRISPRRSKLEITSIYLHTTVIDFNDHAKYLGVFIANTLSDDMDITRQVKSLYARANTLLRKFCHCSQKVKLNLFQAYCASMYCTYLWCQYTVATYNKIRVAYNNIYRKLLGYSRMDSASMMFVTHHLDNFDTMIRKAMYNFTKRISSSTNSIIQCLSTNIALRAGPFWQNGAICFITDFILPTIRISSQSHFYQLFTCLICLWVYKISYLILSYLILSYLILSICSSRVS